MVRLQDVLPSEIESESFQIIESEFFEQTGKEVSEYSEAEFKVLQRVIHATGDFALADTLVFQHDPIQAALSAIRSGGNVLTDVNMVASGISKPSLKKFGGEVFCGVSDPDVAEYAKRNGVTRSDAAIQLYHDRNIAVLAIGNAPTALISALKLIDEGHFKPGVIVGVPVGFVNAAESKELLKEKNISAITVSGRRGGSPIAAAITNALLKLASEN